MTRTRLEAFSDGVIAIIITIMVLELRPPHGTHFEDLWPLWPKGLSYLLSFVIVAIWWNNHHHTRALLRLHAEDSHLARALGADWKGKASTIAYAVSIPLALVSRWAALAIIAGVALVWLVPDRRIERTLERGPHPGG